MHSPAKTYHNSHHLTIKSLPYNTQPHMTKTKRTSHDHTILLNLFYLLHTNHLKSAIAGAVVAHTDIVSGVT